MSAFPVILFVYNRLRHTQQTVTALQNNYIANQTDLFVFSDGAKAGESESVDAVRSYIETITGFKSVTIHYSDTNQGIAQSVISAVSNLIEQNGAVIIVEDDIVTAPYFLSFMNDALRLYKNRKDIFSVSAYTYPPHMMSFPTDYSDDVYLSYRFGGWGWGTWKDRWEQVDWELTDYSQFMKNPSRRKAFARGGEELPYMLRLQYFGVIDAWDIKFDYAHFVHDAYSLRPIKSLVNNIGLDGSGVHCGVTDKLDVELESFEPTLNENIMPHDEVLNNFRSATKRPLLRRLIDRIPWATVVIKRLLLWWRKR